MLGFVIAVTTRPPKTFAIVTGLSSGMSYEFRVTAVNRFGIGLHSPSSPPITMPVYVSLYPRVCATTCDSRLEHTTGRSLEPLSTSSSFGD